MQHPFLRAPPPRSSPPRAGGVTSASFGEEEAYDSFIDIDGFPRAAASFASSPSHSTATSINVDYSSGVPIGGGGGGGGAGWMLGGGRNSSSMAPPVVDWPAESSSQAVEWPASAAPAPAPLHRLQTMNQQQMLPRKSSSSSSLPARDQQIFRRTGSSSTPSKSGSSAGGSGGSASRNNFTTGISAARGGGGGGGIVFESYEATAAAGGNYNGNGASSGSANRNGGTSSILDNIAETVASTSSARRVGGSLAGGGSPPAPSSVAGRARDNLQPPHGSGNNNAIVAQSAPGSVASKRPLHVHVGSASSSPTGTMNGSLSRKRSPPSAAVASSEQTTTSGSISPQSVIRKSGVVNKLVSIFSSKQQQQQQQQRSPQNQQVRSNASPPNNPNRSTAETPPSTTGASPLGSNGLQYLKQSIATAASSSGVQFRVGSSSSPTSSQQRPGAAQLPHNGNNVHPNNSSNSIPAISPARSNAQSSVTGYSGDSSSYNPTGWPGTVDRRGKVYGMEPSYSESEGESLGGGSPRRRIRRPAGGGNGEGDDGGPSPSPRYPVQNYRSGQRNTSHRKGVGFSFDDDGGSTAAAGAAELENWLNGSSVVDDGDQSQFAPSRASGPIDLDEAFNINMERSGGRAGGGPVDLDEAYKRRLDSGGGWREGREGSPLANISETRTSADVQLEAALGMAGRNQQARSSPFQSPSTTNNSMSEDEARLHGIDFSASERRVRASGKRLPSPKIYNEEVDFDDDDSPSPAAQDVYRNNNSYSPPQRATTLQGPQPLSEEALRIKDSQSGGMISGASVMMRGYRAFIDKTKDVPNLMDDLESEASTSLGTGVYSAADARGGRQNTGLAMARANSRRASGFDSGSDVFDGIQEGEPYFGPMEKDLLNVNSFKDGTHQQERGKGRKNDGGSTRQVASSFDGENLPYSTQFNPFAANAAAISHRSQPRHHNAMTDSAEFIDPSLDISAVTKGSANSHHFGDEIMDEEEEDDFESLPDLSIYYIEPEMVRKMVRAFRKLCQGQMEISSSEETMLYDFESLVDTKKAFALFEMRSRIMETDIDRGLERRGGTNVVDDCVLTPYFQAASRVRDAVIVSKAWRDGATPKDVITAHLLTRRSAKAYYVRRPIQRLRRPGVPFYNHGPQYWLEEVKWLDDTDFMMMRCQSLGAGNMRGFEMFTIGDCQSILLKMTSDNCTQLRRELKSAMMRQIEAEELMQEEIDLDGDENVVAEAEQMYREALMEVKALSIKLVLADKAFALVRARMEKLVQTIESLLVQLEDGEEYAGDDDDDVQSEDEEGDSYASQGSQDERVKLAERAKRAEMSAELAVREALQAKQEAEKVKADKQREIDDLKEKLADMETKSQLLLSENRKLVYEGRGANASHYLDDAKSLFSSFDAPNSEDAARKNRLKQQFRERRLSKPTQGSPNQLKSEEIYQHLDFYSRSLNSLHATKK